MAFVLGISPSINREYTPALFSALSHMHNLWITGRDPAKIGRSSARLCATHRTGVCAATFRSADPNVGEDRPDVGRSLQVLQRPWACERLALERLSEVPAREAAIDG